VEIQVLVDFPHHASGADDPEPERFHANLLFRAQYTEGRHRAQTPSPGSAADMTPTGLPWYAPGMDWRPYEPERDRQAAHRIWYEAGWLQPERTGAFEAASSAGRAVLTELDGQPECLVFNAPGSLRYQRCDLPFVGVLAVATSRVGRRQGLAGRLTARAVALDAEAGAAVAGLNIFDQGFYDKLGFGTGCYEHTIALDPLSLDIETPPRRPCRLTTDAWLAVHEGRLARPRVHGGLVFASPQVTRSQMVGPEHAFGLGYYCGDRLTHHLWCLPEGGNRNQGPFRATWLCYHEPQELLELLALLRELGDQVLLVRVREPPGVQLQDLVRRPLRHYAQTDGSRFETRNDARASWQMRICDLEVCVAATSVPQTVSFNLELVDPIEGFLEGGGWRGVGGSYVVTLGPTSEAHPGSSARHETLRADVGAFTRLWLGVLPASGLAITGRLAGPQGLIAKLDEVLAIPRPQPDWDY
jgi:hypothetical protein